MVVKIYSKFCVFLIIIVNLKNLSVVQYPDMLAISYKSKIFTSAKYTSNFVCL